ncbi:MAG: pilus assembly PilX family protein, partial [Oceanobacter sp.]
LMTSNRLSFRQSDGAVLITALLILVVLTLLVLSSSGTSVLNERMAGSYRDTEIAREAAELALRRAEEWLETNITNIAMVEWDAAAAGMYSIQHSTSAPFLYSGIASASASYKMPATFNPTVASSWSNINYSTAGASAQLNILTTQEVTDLGLSQAPRVVIEFAGRSSREGQNLIIGSEAQNFQIRKVGFRITAVAWGRYVNPDSPSDPGTPYVLQSYFAIPL